MLLATPTPAAAALLSGEEGAALPALRTVRLGSLEVPALALTLGAVVGGQFERAACAQVRCCLARCRGCLSDRGGVCLGIVQGPARPGQA